MSALPDLWERRADALDLLWSPRAALFTDIDGTIAPIAPEPSAAAVLPEARDALAALAARVRVVVLTGRSAADARAMVGLDGVVYSGNHGAEWLIGGERSVEPAAAPYLAPLREVAQSAERALGGLTGVRVEDKEVSLSIHYRNAPDPHAARAAILAFADANAAAMAVREGKMIVEVRPPVALSKGEAVRSCVRRERVASAIVIGDDRTDAEAFAVVREMRSAGEIRAACAAVSPDDAPPELIASADYALRGPAAAARLLAWLAAQSWKADRGPFARRAGESDGAQAPEFLLSL